MKMLIDSSLQAAEVELRPKTLKSWAEYVHNVNVSMQQRPHDAVGFLWAEGNRDRMARVREGEIVVWPAGETNPKRVPSGLIHDWIGAALIPYAH
jgi:hypothetical protein